MHARWTEDADGRPACDLESCPKFNVERYLRELRQTIPFVPPVPVQALKALHTARNYGRLVQLIRRTMNVQVNLKLVWTSSGTEDVPAWVETPKNMPFYGSKEFRELTITMTIRKPFMASSTYDRAAIVVAHEFSHVVLNSIRHPLRNCEKAVDLTAMLLGFSALYESGAHTAQRIGNTIRSSQLGYLTADELRTAHRLLTEIAPQPKTSTRRTALTTLQRFGVIALLGGSIATWAVVSKVTGWLRVHDQLLARQAEELKGLPRNLNSNTTLIDITVGFTSITYVHRIKVPTSSVDPSFVARLHNAACTSDRRKTINDGASYVYEYRDPSNHVATFEVSSCP